MKQYYAMYWCVHRLSPKCVDSTNVCHVSAQKIMNVCKHGGRYVDRLLFSLFRVLLDNSDNWQLVTNDASCPNFGSPNVQLEILSTISIISQALS